MELESKRETKLILTSFYVFYFYFSRLYLRTVVPAAADDKDVTMFSGVTLLAACTFLIYRVVFCSFHVRDVGTHNIEGAHGASVNRQKSPINTKRYNILAHSY